MDMRDQERRFLSERRDAIERGERLDALMVERLTIKERLAVRKRANSGENLLEVLREYGIE